MNRTSEDIDQRFARMYETNLPIVYGFVSVRVGGNRALAEDLTSDAFRAAIAEYRNGDEDVVTTSWLLTVARRRLIDHWRHLAVVKRHELKLVTPATTPAPEIGERELVEAAMASLTEEQRAALVLQHLEGHPVAEIAQMMGKSEEAIESLLARARRRFRSTYEEVSHD